eukprot:2141100-Lingulodinium_polyedra.AAC.1
MAMQPYQRTVLTCPPPFLARELRAVRSSLLSAVATRVNGRIWERPRQAFAGGRGGAGRLSERLRQAFAGDRVG